MRIMDLAPSMETFAKGALYVGLIVVPGGSLGLLLLWWLNQRRGKPQPGPLTLRSWAWDPLGRAYCALRSYGSPLTTSVGPADGHRGASAACIQLRSLT